MRGLDQRRAELQRPQQRRCGQIARRCDPRAAAADSHVVALATFRAAATPARASASGPRPAAGGIRGRLRSQAGTTRRRGGTGELWTSGSGSGARAETRAKRSLLEQRSSGSARRWTLGSSSAKVRSNGGEELDLGLLLGEGEVERVGERRSKAEERTRSCR